MGFTVFDSTGAVKTRVGSVNLALDVTGLLPTVNGGTSVDIASAALPLGSGQITFPAAQNASAGANVLDDYEEGTWTPIDGSGAALVISIVHGGTYTKIGRWVHVNAAVTYPSTADGTAMALGGLPFTAIGADFSGSLGTSTIGFATTIRIARSAGTTSTIHDLSGTQLTNTQMSLKTVFYSGAYFS